jgi:hypothetical protein
LTGQKREFVKIGRTLSTSGEKKNPARCCIYLAGFVKEIYNTNPLLAYLS